MGCRLFAAVGCLVIFPAGVAVAQLQSQSPSVSPELQQTPAAQSPAAQPSRDKLARIWANEPPLVRLARDKFGDQFTETDAKFFAGVAANDWADFRPTPETKYDAKDLESWSESPVLKADRIYWLCSDAGALRLVPSRGIWLRGVSIDGKVDLYRCQMPFSLTFYDCLFNEGIDIRNAKLQELDINNSCTARIDARAVEVTENVYLIKTVVYGGMNFVEAQVAGDLDMSGGAVCHSYSKDEREPGVAINLYDAKIDGDVKLSEKFRAQGTVRLIGARIGRSFECTSGQFSGFGQLAIDAQRVHVGRSITLTSGFRAEGGVNICRVEVEGDLECDGGSFIGANSAALNADLAEVGGQVYLGKGFHAEGEVRLSGAVIAKDLNCDNGHFLNPAGNAIFLDSAIIGNNLRMGYDPSVASALDSDLPAGFLARGAVRVYAVQVHRDVLANSGQFDTPAGSAIVATNLSVASRFEMLGATVKGMVDLSGADIEHDLDLRGSQFDGRQAPNRIAIWANGMEVRGHVNTHQIDTPGQIWPFRVDGLMSFNFVVIGKHWNLYRAQFIDPAGYALDASDCRVGGYVNIDQVTIDGRATFSRAKIDGMWILSHMIQPQRMWLDMRFAHIWVIKDERLEDWPPAGQLQLEGLVYDHFDDDSPLSVDDRLAWLRRQYAPAKTPTHVRRGSPDPAETADRRSPLVIPGQKSNALQDSGLQSIVPADFEAPAEMSEPYMAEPDAMASPSQAAPAMPAPVPLPESGATPEDDMFAPMPPPAGVDRMAAPSDVQPTDSQNAPGMAAPTDVAASSADDEENASVAADTTAAATPPDPAGRRYITQPYTQLASVYRAIGQDEHANAVLVARAERLGELAPIFSAEGLWYRYVGRLIGYGYEPFRAIKIGAIIVVFGALVFAVGAQRNLMAETKLAESVLSQEGQAQLVSPSYPRFNPFVYSLDVFLPFADLHQRCYWLPGEKHTRPRRSRNCLMHIGPIKVKWSGVLRAYLWFQTLAGWTLCTLLAAAVTGIVQS